MKKQIERAVSAVRDAQWRKVPVRAPEGYYWDLIASKLIGVYGELVLVEVGREVNVLGFYIKTSTSTDTLTYPQWGENVKGVHDIRAASKRLLEKREKALESVDVFAEVRENVRGKGR